MLGEIINNYRLTGMICVTMALTNCADTEASVNNSLKHEAEELVTAVSDATYREGFRGHDALEETLRILPDQKITTRSLRNFRWDGDTLHAVVSFVNSAQRTEAEGAGTGEIGLNSPETFVVAPLKSRMGTQYYDLTAEWPSLPRIRSVTIYRYNSDVQEAYGTANLAER